MSQLKNVESTFLECVFTSDPSEAAPLGDPIAEDDVDEVYMMFEPFHIIDFFFLYFRKNECKEQTEETDENSEARTIDQAQVSRISLYRSRAFKKSNSFVGTPVRQNPQSNVGVQTSQGSQVSSPTLLHQRRQTIHTNPILQGSQSVSPPIIQQSSVKYAQKVPGGLFFRIKDRLSRITHSPILSTRVFRKKTNKTANLNCSGTVGTSQQQVSCSLSGSRRNR